MASEFTRKVQKIKDILKFNSVLADDGDVLLTKDGEVYTQVNGKVKQLSNPNYGKDNANKILSVSNTGDAVPIPMPTTVNAETAKKLQTPIKINGTNFDGTSDINVPASNDSDIVHKSGNETLNGNKVFTGTIITNNRIQGSLATRIATFTDLATVATDMYTYQGIWWFGSGTLLNSPVSSYVLVEVFHGSTNTNGYIRVTASISGDSYYTNVNNGLSTWNKYAKDATVVHNTGNET